MGIIYNGINAKVKAMGSSLLKREDYSALLQYKTVDEVGQKLKELEAYEKAMATLGGDVLHRSMIEQKILLSLAQDFSKIYTFIGDFSLRNYLDAFFMQYEIEVIKILLCSIYDDRDITYSLDELSSLLGNKLKVDISKLVGSKNVGEFIDSLQGTVFYKLLSNKYEEALPSFFDMEMELDIYYYTNIWNAQNRYLDKKNLKAMKYINGMEIDLRNIQWIYRLKTYYKINDTKIYSYLVPVRYLLSEKQVTAMVEAKSENELREAINATSYGKAFSAEGSVDKIFFLEMARVFKKAQINNPHSLAGVTAYLFFKKMETRNVVSLLECIRYGLTQEETMDYLVLAN